MSLHVAPGTTGSGLEFDNPRGAQLDKMVHRYGRLQHALKKLRRLERCRASYLHAIACSLLEIYPSADHSTKLMPISDCSLGFCAPSLSSCPLTRAFSSPRRPSASILHFDIDFDGGIDAIKGRLVRNNSLDSKLVLGRVDEVDLWCWVKSTTVEEEVSSLNGWSQPRHEIALSTHIIAAIEEAVCDFFAAGVVRFSDLSKICSKLDQDFAALGTSYKLRFTGCDASLFQVDNKDTLTGINYSLYRALHQRYTLALKSVTSSLGKLRERNEKTLQNSFVDTHIPYQFCTS